MRHDAPLDSRQFDALGTRCAVFGVGLSPDRLLEAETWVRDLGARLTRFSSTSELSRLNASGGEWIATSVDMNAILRASLGAFVKSGGLVNIAVLPAVLATGYTRTLT